MSISGEEIVSIVYRNWSDLSLITWIFSQPTTFLLKS
jgi:hypothetical protein